MHNIKRACFTALDASINDAFKVSNDPTIQGWHTSMQVINILDQLSTIYGQPTPAILKTNNAVFCSPYLAADAPEVFFRGIEECAETALLGHNPYTDQQLITNAISLFLTTGLYIWPFKEWNQPTAPNQTWIALCTMIQETFQQRLNATAPTTGHHGYAQAMPLQQNAFEIFGDMMADLDDKSANMVATQVAALTYQSQFTTSIVANLLQWAKQQFAHLASQQNLMHENMHQIIVQVNSLSFNQSITGWGRLGSFNSGGRGRGGSRRQQGGVQMAVGEGQFGGGFIPAANSCAHGPTALVAPYQGGEPPLFHATLGNCQRGPLQYQPPVGGYGAGGHGNNPHGGCTPIALFSNRVNLYANWNACYSCGFDVPDGHTSMMCHTNLCKPTYTLRNRTRNSTLTWGIRAASRTGTRRRCPDMTVRGGE